MFTDAGFKPIVHPKCDKTTNFMRSVLTVPRGKLMAKVRINDC